MIKCLRFILWCSHFKLKIKYQKFNLLYHDIKLFNLTFDSTDLLILVRKKIFIWLQVNLFPWIELNK